MHRLFYYITVHNLLGGGRNGALNLSLTHLEPADIARQHGATCRTKDEIKPCERVRGLKQPFH